MSKVEFITTPSGDRMAVMPVAEYERLVEAAEDAADVHAYDRRSASLPAAPTSCFRPSWSTGC